jgi:hypothetical protein
MRRLLAFARTTLSGIALTAWFVSMLGLGAGLLARHMLPLRAPQDTKRLGASLDGLRSSDERGRWLAVHVLYADCRCSLRIADHLALTVRPPEWAEVVLWVGEPGPSPDLGSRFDVRRVSSADLARYGIEAAPLLVAIDPAGTVHYVGGYTDRKQGPVIDDRRLMAAARDSDFVPSLPVYGCAVSDRLQNELATLPTL